MLIHFKLFYYYLCFITRWFYAYICINMCIGFVFRIVKNPSEQPVLVLTLESASSKTGGTKKPAEHPVRGLKPVHHL